MYIYTHTYQIGGTKLMLLDNFTKHPSRSAADHVFKSVLCGRCGTVNYHPLSNLWYFEAFGGWKWDQGTTKLHARILTGKGVRKKKPHMFTVGSSTSATFVLPVYIHWENHHSSQTWDGFKHHELTCSLCLQGSRRSIATQHHSISEPTYSSNWLRQVLMHPYFAATPAIRQPFAGNLLSCAPPPRPMRTSSLGRLFKISRPQGIMDTKRGDGDEVVDFPRSVLPRRLTTQG